MPIIRILAQRFARLAAVGAVALTIVPLHAATASGQAIDLAAGLLSPDDVHAPELSGDLPRQIGDNSFDTRADDQGYSGKSIPNADTLDFSENVQARVDDYGMVAQFYIGTQIVPDDAQSDAHPYLIVRATRFSQASEATRYIDETVAKLIDNPAPYDRVDPIPADDMPVYGDATSGYAYTCSVPDQEPSDGVAILFQQGRVVYELELEGVVAPDMTVVDAVVQDMLDCAQDGCETAVTVPDSLTEYIDEQSLLGRKSG